MKTFMERANELAIECKRVKGNNVYETLAVEYGIGKRAAGDRFKSLFGVPVRDYITSKITPSKDKVIDCFLKTSSWEDMYAMSGFNDPSGFSKVLHGYFGQSNYFKIKLLLLSQRTIVNYNPTLADNESILISQYFGDGHVERRNSFKIEHGYKQYDYLKFKIGLMNKAFPETNGLGHIKRREFISKGSQYVSFSWRSGEKLGKYIEKILNRSTMDNVKAMTPFGILLYFLDDGCLYGGVDKSSQKRVCELSFSSIKEELRLSLIENFKTYGYSFNNYPTCIALNSRPEIIKFMKDFIEPYKHLIPECLHYKIDYKDIVG